MVWVGHRLKSLADHGLHSLAFQEISLDEPQHAARLHRTAPPNPLHGPNNAYHPQEMLAGTDKKFLDEQDRPYA